MKIDMKIGLQTQTKAGAAIRLQGLIFCGLSVLLVLASWFFPPLPERLQVLLLALAITLFGVPHGALDPLLARRIFGLNSAPAWGLFLLLYLLLAGAVVLLWLSLPVFFLAAFFVLSTAHFSADPAGQTPIWFRFLYGGAALVLPALLHQDQLTQLLAYLIDAEAATAFAGLLKLLAWPWLLALLLAAAWHAKTDSLASLELLCVAALALWISPLAAFTLFFCAMHGARHVLRVNAFVGAIGFIRLLRVAALPMLALLLGAAAAWQWLPALALEARVVQMVFVTLAALTVPHMCLVERLRWGAWVRF